MSTPDEISGTPEGAMSETPEKRPAPLRNRNAQEVIRRAAHVLSLTHAQRRSKGEIGAKDMALLRLASDLRKLLPPKETP